MFSDVNVVGCFPTPIWRFHVRDADAFNRRLLAEIAKVRQSEGWDAATVAAGRGGFGDNLQSQDDLHLRPEFAEFNTAALGAARQVFDRLKYAYQGCYLTGLWFNISVRGYSHKEHVHPNNFLSGVYYAKAHQGCGSIVFDDPRPQVKVLIPDILEPNPYNTHNFEVEPNVGDMVLFPSWLPHRVRANATEGERISVAFNVMFKGKLGFARAFADL